MAYTNEVKEAARRLYIKGAKPSEIKQRLNLASERIVYYWAAQSSWAELIAHDTPLDALERRMSLILESDPDTELNSKYLNELDRLVSIRGKLLQQARLKASSSETDNNQPSQGSNKSRKSGKKAKNDISHITKEILDDWFNNHLFDYQKEARAEKNNKAINRTRNYLKSRQIGFTWYFAHEALEDAILTGDNQIFISASKAQAHLFRAQIVLFGQDLGVELTGSPMMLSNGAMLYFLSTNVSTAQGASGHLYTDEYFWIKKFKELQEVTAGMASHKKWRKTYFSTISSKEHEAYEFWNGTNYKNSKVKNKKPWPTDQELAKGVLCPDGQFRKIVTIDDAITGGCNLFDIEQLKNENSAEAFEMLYRCKFPKDGQGVFKLSDLEKALSDPSEWKDFKAELVRPFANKPVWLGYDPSRLKDDACVVVIAPPDKDYNYFRVLEVLTWRDKNYLWQAEQVKQLTERYNVEFIGIDTTSQGLGVFDIVRQFFPQAVSIHYSLETKTALVIKAQEVFSNARIKWDCAKSELAASFLTIRRKITGQGNATYSSDRTDKTGHADRAWAIMHALYHEGLNYNMQQQSTVKFYG